MRLQEEELRDLRADVARMQATSSDSEATAKAAAVPAPALASASAPAKGRGQGNSGGMLSWWRHGDRGASAGAGRVGVGDGDHSDAKKGKVMMHGSVTVV